MVGYLKHERRGGLMACGRSVDDRSPAILPFGRNLRSRHNTASPFFLLSVGGELVKVQFIAKSNNFEAFRREFAQHILLHLVHRRRHGVVVIAMTRHPVY